MNQSNLNTAEIDKFETLSLEWWDPKGKLRTLHTINPVRLRYIEQSVALNGKSVLDIGCGGGLLSEAMAEKGAEVTGLDASKVTIEIAKEHQRSTAEGGNPEPVDYLTGTAEEYAQQCVSQYDVITCMELLEHVPDPSSLISCCATMLKPGGHIFLATINRNLKSYASAVLGAEYLLGLLPKGTHDYSGFIRPAELCAWLRDSGFSVVDISGMTYVPGIDLCTLTNQPDVNYLLHAELTRSD